MTFHIFTWHSCTCSQILPMLVSSDLLCEITCSHHNCSTLPWILAHITASMRSNMVCLYQWQFKSFSLVYLLWIPNKKIIWQLVCLLQKFLSKAPKQSQNCWISKMWTHSVENFGNKLERNGNFLKQQFATICICSVPCEVVGNLGKCPFLYRQQVNTAMFATENVCGFCLHGKGPLKLAMFYKTWNILAKVWLGDITTQTKWLAQTQQLYSLSILFSTT